MRKLDKFNVADYIISKCNIGKNIENKTAFYYEDDEITYFNLRENVNKFANAFGKMRIKEGEHIGILLSDRPELIYSFCGAIKAGIIPVLINVRQNKENIEYIVEDSQIKLLITEKRLNKKIEYLKSSFLEKIIFAGRNLTAEEDINTIADNCETSYVAAETSAEDVAFLIYTSGSNGKPKGVLHQHKTIPKCIEDYAKGILNVDESDIVYSISKMTHTYGLGNTTFQTFGVGASSVVSDGETVFEIIGNIKKYKPTIFFAVPSVYVSLLKMADNENLDLSSIRMFVSAGEALPKTLWEQWKERFGYEILDGLGNTESLTTFVSNRPGCIKPGSLGKTIKGYDIKIVDDNNKPVAVNTVGNCMVCGETFMKGYWNKAKKNDDLFVDGYFKTGDKFYIDEDGFLWYAGRNIDVFKVNGCWVKSFEIENVLISHDKIKEALVIGQGGDNVTQLSAYIVVDDNVEPSIEFSKEVKRFVKARLEHFKCPKFINFVSEIPKGATGKIIRKKLPDELVIFKA